MEPISLFFAGDFCSSSPKSIVLDNQLKALIASSDISVVNFEGPLRTSNYNMPNNTVLQQSDESPLWCEDNGFSIITLANNHINDFGQEGIIKTIESFKIAKTIGVGVWDEAYSVYYKKIKGKTIGFLSLSSADLGSLQNRWTDDGRLGSAWINHPSIDKIIIDAKLKCDYLFVLPHAGIEHIPVPLPEWREKYMSLIDMGANAIIASHPHIVQGYEKYKGAPIIYSLGNFFFDYYSENGKPENWDKGMVIRIVINEEGLEIEPFFTSKINNMLQLDENQDRRDELRKMSDILYDKDSYLELVNHYIMYRTPEFLSWLYSGLGVRSLVGQSLKN